MDRQFARQGLDLLWGTDITERPTREGKVYCAVVLDVCSRRVAGWAIDSSARSVLILSHNTTAITAAYRTHHCHQRLPQSRARAIMGARKHTHSSRENLARCHRTPPGAGVCSVYAPQFRTGTAPGGTP
ncbi:DDE-type integrase/transposase/recombinase [Nocardiopsis tropica]|uniref:DDE-type integrase/transposase/recombinase n=1 Tax=Nocardiopsis tropica TaxID=109330 RepID=UPI003A8E2E6B